MRIRLSVVVLAVGFIALVAGACAPPVTPEVWVAAGCIDGAGTDGATAPDLNYNGSPNSVGNATMSAVISGASISFSGNGTCTGQPVGAITIVQAVDPATASTICTDLGQGTATTFAGSAWTLPADAYSCSTTITL